MMEIKTDATRQEIKRVVLLLCEASHRDTQIIIYRKNGGIRYSGKAIEILCETAGR